MSRTIVLFSMLAASLAVGNAASSGETKAGGAGWVRLFDGKTLDGWKANGNPQSFHVRDGAVVAQGKLVSHLFYTGPVNEAVFRNFEFKVDVMTSENSNGGIYFHTQYDDHKWPGKGFEIQINNTYKDKVKTGSLYWMQDVEKAMAKDNEWFTVHVIVRAKRVVVRLNGKTVVDWTEPKETSNIRSRPPFWYDRSISSGTFGLQAHDAHSVMRYKNIMVKPLP